MFFLVSGASASGKSTVAKGIAARLETVDCHDCDEKVTTTADERCEQLEEWVQEALAPQESGRDFLLVTHSPLGELLACPSAQELTGVAACLLDCNDRVRLTRIRERGIDPKWPPSQHTLNWAAWHRVHAWDPQWEQHVIVGNGPEDHAYDRWTDWAQGDPRWQVHVIDTSELGVERLLTDLGEWVESERTKTPALSPSSRWWE